MRQRILSGFGLILLLSITGCASVPGSPPSQLRWGTYHTHAANNGVLLFGDVGDEVRLRNPVGAVVSAAVLHAPDQGLCKANYVLPLSSSDIASFDLAQHRWPAGYHLQTVVAGKWTDIVTLGGGCNATE